MFFLYKHYIEIKSIFFTEVNITLENASVVISEDVGTIRICVTLSDAAMSTDRPFSVNVITQNLSATGNDSIQ